MHLSGPGHMSSLPLFFVSVRCQWASIWSTGAREQCVAPHLAQYCRSSEWGPRRTACATCASGVAGSHERGCPPRRAAGEIPEPTRMFFDETLVGSAIPYASAHAHDWFDFLDGLRRCMERRTSDVLVRPMCGRYRVCRRAPELGASVLRLGEGAGATALHCYECSARDRLFSEPRRVIRWSMLQFWASGWPLLSPRHLSECGQEATFDRVVALTLQRRFRPDFGHRRGSPC